MQILLAFKKGVLTVPLLSKVLLLQHFSKIKVLLENCWNSNQMITEGEVAIPLETSRRAFRNQEKSKQKSVIIGWLNLCSRV